MSRFWLGFAAGLAVAALLAAAVFVPRWLARLEAAPDRRIIYRDTPQGALRLEIFEARQAGGPAPALLLFHGGAWQYGSPSAFQPQCRVFAQHGITCISAEYRIASRHGTDPRAAVQDARAAFAHVRAHAAELGIDAGRIFVGGGSAGGHLAAALGVGVPLPPEAAAPDMARPAGMVLYNPMLDLSPCTPDHHLVAGFWREISPLQSVGAEAAPALVLLGTEDLEVPVPVAQGFCDAMQAHGRRCELALYEGARHGFFNRDVAGGRFFEATNQRVIEFILGDARRPL